MLLFLRYLLLSCKDMYLLLGCEDDLEFCPLPSSAKKDNNFLLQTSGLFHELHGLSSLLPLRITIETEDLNSLFSNVRCSIIISHLKA